MSLGQSLQQRQLQRLSPQQIQLMKLLQIPTAQIEQRVKEEIAKNEEKQKRATPRVPMWSPTIVLTWPKDA